MPRLPVFVQRARELLSEGDQGSGGSGIKILLAALAAAPGLQTLLADAVVHRCGCGRSITLRLQNHIVAAS